MPCGPEITLANHHPDFPMDEDWLAAALEKALQACVGCPGDDVVPLLAGLDEVEINLVDDATIDGIHREFMGIAGATDVITFQHGEIFVSLDTAARVAAGLGSPVAREILLYAVHGLLHLHGYDDTTADARQRMQAAQERLVDDVMRSCPPHG